MIPGLLLPVALAVEAGGWAAAQIAAQRAADVAAIAGGLNYMSTASNQTAATFAARVAQLNGASGTASPSWDSGTNTLTDNMITAQIVAGYKASSDKALRVTVRKTVPAFLSQAFNATAAYTVTGSGTAELITTTVLPTGPGADQPCLVALAGNTGITTGTGITVNGSVVLDAMNCTIRSNDKMLVNGSNTVTAQAIFTGGAFTNNGSNTITGTVYQNQGQIPDPYAGVTALQTALSDANDATGTGTISCNGGSPWTCTGPAGSFSCASSTCTISPGTYSGLILNGSGTVTLNPGLYVFTGSIVVNGTVALTASSVTILMAARHSGTSNTLTVNGSSTFAASAATTAGATNGQIAGIVFASLSTGGTVFNGSDTSPNVGVVYYPKGSVTVNGSDSTGSPGCSQLIAKTLVINGNPTFDVATCSSYGTASFTSVAPTTTMTAQVVH